MRQKPQIVTEFISEFLGQGWNKSQATSLAWAEYFEEWMGIQASKMRGDAFFGPEVRIDCYCSDCKDGGQLLPSTTIMWLGMHKNHKTKTIKIR
jgi:hypothetical protein